MNRQQFAAACFLSLLSPMIRILPKAAAAAGGAVSVWSAIPAFGILLLFGWWMLRFADREPQGMAALFIRCLGKGFGRVVLFLYALAFLLYIGFILRVGADRLIATVYPESGPTVFVLVMLLLCLTAAMGRLRALGRAAVILRAMMLAVLVLVFVMAAKGLDPKLLRAPQTRAIPALFSGALPMVNVGGFALCFSFLGCHVEKNASKLHAYFPWVGILCLVMLLLGVTVIGRLGEGLSASLRYPFFTMVRELSLLQLADRVEALIVAMWVFSDFMLCSLLLRCSYETLRECFGLTDAETLPYFTLQGGKWLLIAETFTAGLFAFIIAQSSAELLPWSERIIPRLFAGLIFGGFPLVWAVGRIRKKI